ncbi:unnamed protein product [Protopolystoma xenopodis]|uniref:Copper transport protein ATOX1 n=1 Tax=Protopolystoma xenopodis TaxID=117903 RepID=A0A3S5BLT7_9PLAT|nr:unnamed protein product [Protopolystoma xenopodis]
MREHIYAFRVEFPCEGCASAARRVLDQLDGIISSETSVEEKLVKVKTTLPYQEVIDQLKKTSKPVEYIGELTE